jgi:hypothetical protein
MKPTAWFFRTGLNSAPACRYSCVMSNFSHPSFLPCLSGLLFGGLLLRVKRT